MTKVKAKVKPLRELIRKEISKLNGKSIMKFMYVRDFLRVLKLKKENLDMHELRNALRKATEGIKNKKFGAEVLGFDDYVWDEPYVIIGSKDPRRMANIDIG